MNKKICNISLFSAILACVTTMPSNAAIKAKNSNRSYANAYQQINAMRYEQEYAKAMAETAATATSVNNLPVAVDDENLANLIINHDTGAPDISKLESCALIYPNGVFKWAVPESGVRQTPTAQCVAVVELRDANTNKVLATTTVAAGDSMKCNIDYFPQYGYNLSELSNVELPADVGPTMADVESVMNTEQKQNAGLKIIAAALVSGVAGNVLAPKEAGDTRIVGSSKTQLKDTAIGAVTGAGVMAASVYSGKVAGDTIKSTAVNTASGMILGNMLAGAGGGDSVLETTKCSVDGVEHDCIAGKFNTMNNDSIIEENKILLINKDKMVYECNSGLNGCKPFSNNIMNITIRAEDGSDKKFEEIIQTGKDINRNNMVRYKLNPDNSGFEKITTNSYDLSNVFFKITGGNLIEKSNRAYAVFPVGTLSKKTGYKISDWESLKKQKPKYYYRNSDYTIANAITDADAKGGDFTPSTRDAEDGALVDLSNEARIKGTVTGGAVGGALGGIAGYSGAKNEVSERWATAVREYEDSLSNFVCVTGGRYLSKYNSYVDIPEPQKAE